MTVSVKGITPEDFANWKHNPVSKVVRRFLKDYADSIGKEALNQFLGKGALFTESAQLEMRGRMLAALEASELSFESLASFYQAEEDDAAETHSD